jgi:hypothetical protein
MRRSVRIWYSAQDRRPGSSRVVGSVVAMPMRSRVMYIEMFGGLGSWGGRIGRVHYSKTRKTLQ